MNFTMLSLPLQLGADPLAFDLQALATHLATVPDLRDPRGVRYPLSLLLTLAVLAKLAGYSQLREIADWAHLRQAELTALLGCPRRTLPHPTTWSRVFATAVDPTTLAQVVTAFFQRQRRPTAPRAGALQLSIDGKTLQGTIPAGQTHGVHLVAAYLPQEGLVLAQVAVTKKANELTVTPTLLAQLPLAGVVVTGDAMFAQRNLSVQIVAAGGEYVWTVKKNQRQLYEDISLLFAPLRPDERASDFDFRTARTVEKGHGRVEERTIRVSSLLNDYCAWPELAQVFEVTSNVTNACGQTTTSVRYGITSLSAQEARPDRLLAVLRGHWGQENGLHYRRDVTLGEDRSQVRLGQAAQILATLNNVVVGLATQHQEPNLAALQRRVAYRFDKGLQQFRSQQVNTT